VFGDPYADISEDARIAEKLTSASPEDILPERYTYGANYPQDLIERTCAYARESQERGLDWWREEKGKVHAEWGLDIGCGIGAGLWGLSQHCKHVVGVDIALRNLVTARALIGNDIPEVFLIAACAESLPFRDARFDVLSSIDVIEHVSSQEQFLSEGYRVLKPGGIWKLNSPNRYSLFTPEPHVNVWGLGFLPRRWQAKYVFLRKGIGYEGKRLLSFSELRGLLGRNEWSYCSVEGISGFLSAPAQSWKGRLLRRMVKLPGMSELLNFFVPSFTVLLVK